MPTLPPWTDGAPVTRPTLVEVEELNQTARGAGGFGSTGR
jgi:dUTPase